MTEDRPEYWKRCSTCKKPLGFGELHYTCSVSTCNRKRSGMVFCSLPCWEAHVPVMSHREAWAEERMSPTQATWQAAQARNQPQERPAARSEARPVPPTAPTGQATAVVQAFRPVTPRAAVQEEILVVASKVKAYIKERSGMNTSDRVMEVLSDVVRHYAERGIKNAEMAERKTVMDRDIR